MSQKNFATAINEAIHQAMEIDESVICYGLGVTDPKTVFGTTANLEKRFGSERVFDMPTSENAMTGVAIGAALNGVKSVMTHQRIDFFLLAMDQLVNSAAKWHYMFGSQNSISITIRLIIGRGWGQGPTHSQNLQAWFAHIPGLKVVMPTTPEDAKGLEETSNSKANILDLSELDIDYLKNTELEKDDLQLSSLDVDPLNANFLEDYLATSMGGSSTKDGVTVNGTGFGYDPTTQIYTIIAGDKVQFTRSVGTTVVVNVEKDKGKVLNINAGGKEYSIQVNEGGTNINVKQSN